MCWLWTLCARNLYQLPSVVLRRWHWAWEHCCQSRYNAFPLHRLIKTTTSKSGSKVTSKAHRFCRLRVTSIKPTWMSFCFAPNLSRVLTAIFLLCRLPKRPSWGCDTAVISAAVSHNVCKKKWYPPIQCLTRTDFADNLSEMVRSCHMGNWMPLSKQLIDVPEKNVRIEFLNTVVKILLATATNLWCKVLEMKLFEPENVQINNEHAWETICRQKQVYLSVPCLHAWHGSCVKDSVWESYMWKMVGDKVMCKKWWVIKLYLKKKWKTKLCMKANVRQSCMWKMKSIKVVCET